MIVAFWDRFANTAQSGLVSSILSYATSKHLKGVIERQRSLRSGYFSIVDTGKAL